jgi:transcription termination/antitermination protein NusG
MTISRDTAGSWFAIHTYSKHEHKVADHLVRQDVTVFLPLLREVHVWSDRRKSIEVPLFSGYLFIKTASWRQIYLSVARTPGVLRWVGYPTEPTTIPDSQIDAISKILADHKLNVARHPFLQRGERVRVRGGSMDGIEGRVVRISKDSRLVVSIDLLQQSVSVALHGYTVERVSQRTKAREDQTSEQVPILYRDDDPIPEVLCVS